MATSDPVERLSRIPLFRGLSPQALELIRDLTLVRPYPAQSILFSQGELPTHFLALVSGEVLETWDQGTGAVPKRRATTGSILGRWAVFNGQPHTTTAVAATDALVLSIPVADFRSLLGRYPLLRQRLGRYDTACRLRGIPLFSSLTDEELFHAADLLERVEYEPGEAVFTRGACADTFYVVDEGRVAKRRRSLPGTTSTRRLTAGAFFGHEDLLQGTARQASVEAVTHTALFEFSPEAFEWLRRVHPGFARGLQGTDVASPLGTVPLFANFSQEELQDLAGYAGQAHLRRGETLFAQGEDDATLYLLLEGQGKQQTVDESRTVRPLPPLQAGEVVGGPNLFVEEPWAFSLEAATRTVWLYLTRTDLVQFLRQRPAARNKLVPSDRSMLRSKVRGFRWLTVDEEELLRRRRHVFSFLRALVLWPGLLPWGLAVLLTVLSAGRSVPGPDWLRVSAGGLLSLWLLWCILDYWNDLFIVTTRRVVYREKVIGLYESLSEVPLGRIQNVVIRQELVGNLFRYGRLNVDTAAASGIRPLSFTFLRNPNAVKALILEERERTVTDGRSRSRRLIRERIDTSTREGLRTRIPRPAAPPDEGPGRHVRPGILARAWRASLGHLFWLEQRRADRVTWRKHPLRLLAKVWAPTVLAAAAGLAYWGLRVSAGLSPWALGAALLPLGVWWWWRWADWGNDLYIVTRDRIIDTERLPLGLRTSLSEAPFDRIQNVTYELPNLVANLFDYGTVSIYTAGVEGKMDFVHVPHPRRVQAEIFERMAAFEEEQKRKQQEGIDLADWFGVYERSH